MKRTVFLLSLVALLLLLPVKVSAEEISGKEYLEQIENLTDGSTEKILGDLGIDLQSENPTENFGVRKVFSVIADFLKNGIKTPLKATLSAVSVMLIYGLLFSFSVLSDEMKSVITTVCKISVTLGIVYPVYELISVSADTLKTASGFMTGFVPVFAGTLAVSGKAATSVSSAGIILLSAEAVSFIASFIVVPLLASFLAVSVFSGFGEENLSSGFASVLKKAGMTVLSVISAVFVGVLSIKNSVASAADSLSTRTVKFVLGSFVPVAGGALSETVSEVISGVRILSTNVGICGILAVSAILLPIIAEILLYRLSMFVISLFARAFSLNGAVEIAENTDAVLSLLFGIILLFGSAFIISLGIVMSK